MTRGGGDDHVETKRNIHARNTLFPLPKRNQTWANSYRSLIAFPFMTKIQWQQQIDIQKWYEKCASSLRLLAIFWFESAAKYGCRFASDSCKPIGPTSTRLWITEIDLQLALTFRAVNLLVKQIAQSYATFHCLSSSESTLSSRARKLTIYTPQLVVGACDCFDSTPRIAQNR